MPRYLEDFEIGETWTSPTVAVSQEDMVRFAEAYDPQPIHTDPEKAAASRFGTVIASGWYVNALAMRLFVESGAYGDTPAVGIGIDELRWRRPVRPGDRLTVTREVVGVDPSERRPAYGTIRTKVTVTNQDGDVVMSQIALSQVPRRPQGV